MNDDHQGSLAEDLLVRFTRALESDPETPVEDWVQRHPAYEEQLRKVYARVRSSTESEAAKPTCFFTRYKSSRSTASTPGQWIAGQVFGDFRLVERINSGGMGEVWRAAQGSLGREVAVKLLLPKFVFSQRARRQFQREAEAGGRVQHPGIVTVYAAGFANDQPYIAQELVRGGYTLANFIADMRELPALPPDYHEQIAEFLARVLDALQVAHDAGVVHRDLKPQNILISPDDAPKIADFGLAQIVDEEPLSETGDFAGTYSYMSPEQAAARRSGIDHRTDVFSLGVTFYEMLTFHRAFDGVTTHEITRKVLFVDPPDPRAVRPETPADLALICAKAMEKAPHHRYATAAEFAADLRRYLHDEPIAARPTGIVRKARKLVRRHPTPAAVASVGALALIVTVWLGSLWLSSQQSERIAERDKLYWQAQFAIEMDDMDAAIGLVDEANALDPESPAGHLILALGFAKYARIPEQERQIALAIEKGFSRDPASLETAADHASYGLYLASQRDLALFPEAEEHLKRALELDPTLYGINFRLYQLRSELDDLDGARRYLDAFQKRLATGETFYTVVEAMKHELDGDYGAACETLEALAADPALDEQRLVELRIHRNLGRNYLKLGELDRAEEHLRLAVDEAPDDCVSWLALAEVVRQRDERLGGEDRGPELLEEADRLAERAIDCNPSKAESYQTRAMIAVELFSRVPTSDEARAKPTFEQAQARIAELREHGARDPSVESRLVFQEGVYPYDRGDYAEALSIFEAALDIYPDNLSALALIGQCCWRVGDYGRGADYLSDALRVFDDPSNEGRWARKWLHAALVWLFDCALKSEDFDTAMLAKERMVSEFDAGLRPEPEELLTFAEFLATAPDELRDCELAHWILEEFDLGDAFDDPNVRREAQAILDLINRSCPPR